MKNVQMITVLCFLLPIALLSIMLAQKQYNFEFSSTKGIRLMRNFEKRMPDSQVGCELPKLDPWDRTIQKYLNPNFKSNENCIPQRQLVTTKLSNRILYIVRTDINSTFDCKYRCHYYGSEFYGNATAWINLENSVKTNCEIVQTMCLHGNETVHEDLHTQIIKVSNEDNFANRSHNFKPSVLIFVLDSVSNSNGLRSLAKTNEVLRYKYDGINFRGLNKVALNSRPNAWALFTGIRITELPAGTFHEQAVKSELSNNCQKYVDDFSYIGRNFSAEGYRSTLIEDWTIGIFNWPNCYGFRTNPVTHNMKPYWQALEANSYTYELLRKQCKTTYSVSMEFLEQFMNAYDNDIPKFSVVWLTEPAHYYINGLYEIDQSLAQFFIKYEAQLENSFIFLMGDHGLRFTGIRSTKIGEIEDNNPFLSMSVPKELRRNEQLMNNLFSNSQILVTHFDLYLTLMDIATLSPLSNFTDFDAFDWSGYMPKDRGSSILRPIGPSERNCKSLDIPEIFCNCKRNRTELTISKGNTNNALLIKGAELLTLALNNVINEHHATNKCAENIFADINSAEMIQESGKLFYSITYSVVPSNGTFQGFVRRHDNNTLSLVSTIQNRINEYGTSSFCVSDERLKPICYCKDLMIQTSPLI